MVTGLIAEKYREEHRNEAELIAQRFCYKLQRCKLNAVGDL